jgi:type II secretory ATPase GspE/PulE/Tfp pilus assembly ATPase PilB-like protein
MKGLRTMQSERVLRELRTQGELDSLDPTFMRTLAKELDVLSLVSRMCPVLFNDASAGVFVLSQHYHDDQTGALLHLLKQRGYRLNPKPLVVLSPALLIAVTKSVRTAGTVAIQIPETSVNGNALSLAMSAILLWAFKHRASDIHFNVNRTQSESAVMFTIDGRYVCPDLYARLPTATMLAMLAVTWMDVEGGNGAVFDPTIEQQGRLVRELGGHRVCLRWASLATDQGPSVCLRLLILDSTELTPELDELGYLDSQIEALRRASLKQGGAIVLAGTVGSGKSTTLATMMREIPAHRKVITLEDPAEYWIPHALQNTVSRSSDEDELSVFDNKLKTFKRSAMNDLLIGEIRDSAGGRAFSDLAGSGISIYTTVHAGSALWVPERLASSFIGVPRDLLATPGILKLLVFQCLLPLLCQGCAQNYEQVSHSGTWQCAFNQTRSSRWRDSWIDMLEEQTGLSRNRLRFKSAQGCERCSKGLSELCGISGRTVAAEMIEPSEEPEFLSGLRRNDGLFLHQWFAQRSKSPMQNSNMQGKSARECALYKVWAGLVDPRTVEQTFGMMPVMRESTRASL